jgi:hypothetical protein
MPDPKTFRNDQVKRMAERFLFGVSEDSLRGQIPQKYSAVCSRRDDRIAGILDKNLKIK